MTTLDASFRIQRFANASFFATGLFKECFALDFPVPREDAGLSIPTPAQDWRQYVAFYKWSESHIEPVGFCNWIRYADTYLCGGMCVSRTFYRRLPRPHWVECRERGGVAQLLLEQGFRELQDCRAWFGYCGDRKAYIVDMRAGFAPTRYPLVIAKWQTGVTETERRALEDRIAAIGPF